MRLPRKAGMASMMGTAVHNTVEDLCNLDISDRDEAETGWLPPTAQAILDRHWAIEKATFLETPRHPRFKDEEIERAHELLIGSLNILIAASKIGKVGYSEMTIGQWVQVQDCILAAEGTLRSSCGRLMGRLDLLVKELDESGEVIGWIVADLKTGRPPVGMLKETVSRQLRFYRDLLMEINPDHPPIRAEGWYSEGSQVFAAEGPSVLPDAFRAWEGMFITEEPLKATPNQEGCGFCEWKAWCPAWLPALARGQISFDSIFRDEVVIVHRFDADTGAVLVERMVPKDEVGGLVPTGDKFGLILAGQALVQMAEHQEAGRQGPLFLGSVLAKNQTWRMGDWSEILVWEPILKSRRGPGF